MENAYRCFDENIDTKYIDDITNKDVISGLECAMFKSIWYIDNEHYYYAERLKINGKNGLKLGTNNSDKYRLVGFDIEAEDPRLICVNDILYVVFICDSIYPEIYKGIGISEFENWNPVYLRVRNMPYNPLEKNWAPFVKNGELNNAEDEKSEYSALGVFGVTSTTRRCVDKLNNAEDARPKHWGYLADDNRRGSEAKLNNAEDERSESVELGVFCGRSKASEAKLYFVYSYDPLMIIKYDFNQCGYCDIVYLQEGVELPINTGLPALLRGGSNLIPYRDKYYIGACHDRMGYNDRINYFTHIVLLDVENWKIVYVSKPIMYKYDGMKLHTIGGILYHITNILVQSPVSIHRKSETKFILTVNVCDFKTLMYEIEVDISEESFQNWENIGDIQNKTYNEISNIYYVGLP